MKRGKTICEKLKQIRLEIAKANDIDYTPAVCESEGDCSGTCPACEKEVKSLEEELAQKNTMHKIIFDPESGEFTIGEQEEDDFDIGDIITEGAFEMEGLHDW